VLPDRVTATLEVVRWPHKFWPQSLIKCTLRGPAGEHLGVETFEVDEFAAEETALLQLVHDRLQGFVLPAGEIDRLENALAAGYATIVVVFERSVGDVGQV